MANSQPVVAKHILRWDGDPLHRVRELRIRDLPSMARGTAVASSSPPLRGFKLKISPSSEVTTQSRPRTRTIAPTERATAVEPIKPQKRNSRNRLQNCRAGS